MLKKSRRKNPEWEKIFQAIGQPALILDNNHTIINANVAALKVSGMSGEDIIGRKCYELFHSKSSHPDGCPLRNSLDKNITDTVEQEASAFGGTFLVCCTPIIDPDGNLDKIIHIATDITEHKRLEKALRQSETRLKQAQSIAQLGSWEIDVANQTMWGSKEAARIYGIEIGDADSAVRPLKTIQGMVHPEDRTRLDGAMQALLKENSDYDEVFRIFRANDSEMRVIRTRADLFHSNKGTPLICGTIEDITERKQTEDALKLSETRLKQAQSVAGLGCWELDLTSKTVWGSREAAFIYGIEYPGEDAAFRPNDKLQAQIHPEDLPRVNDGLKALLTENREYDMEYRIFRESDGELRLIRSRADLVVSDSGHPVNIIGTIEDITERKRTEGALKNAEEKYRHIFENAMEGIFQTTPEGRFLTVNRALAELFGYGSPEEIVESVTDLGSQIYVNPGDREKLLLEVRQKGSVSGYECEFYRKDRSRIWIAATMRAVRGERGEIIHYEGFLLDITGKKAAEQRVADALRYNQAILDASPVGIITYKASGQCVSANKEAARIVGGTVEQLLSLNFHRLESWKDSVLLEAAEMTLKTGQSHSSEFHLVTTFGKESWFSWSFTPLVYAGEPHLLLVVADIAERRQAEESLRRSEEKYRLITENSLDLIWTVNLDGQMTYASPSWKTLLGYEENEVIGRHFGRYIIPEDVPWIMDIIAGELLKYDGDRIKTKTIETKLRRKDGTLIDAEIAASWLYDSAGEITGIQGTSRDITERIKMQEGRARLEAQLAQAHKMEAIGTLAGGIAHDFNNILMSILGYTDIALASLKIDDMQRHYLKQVYRAGERARDLVKQILTFSRHQEQELKPLYMEQILRESLALLRSSLPSTVMISQNIPDDTSVILANPTQIQQILMNLCTNASHAMKESGGILEIRLSKELVEDSELPQPLGLAPGRYVKMTISDTGKGIDPSIMDRIFDPFFTTKSPEEGTGLGLSVVYGIVRNHGGAIDIKSEPGKGTMVSVYLPIYSGAGPVQEEMPEAIPGGTEKILFIDDEPGLADLGKITLESLGYIVTTTTSGTEALQEFHANPDGFDLVITDMTMPKMTGAEIAREMIAVRPDIPIILCTGYSDIISEEKAKQIGIRQFILKPVSLKTLADAVRGVLKK